MKINDISLKKLTASILSLAAVLSIASFGSSVSSENPLSDNADITAAAAEAEEKIDKTSIRWVANYGNLRLDTPKKRLDPEEVYKNLKYTNDMFHGNYLLPDVSKMSSDDSDKKFFDEHKTIEVKQSYSDNKISITYLPYQFVSNSSSDNGEFELRFMDEDLIAKKIDGDIVINGNQLTFKPVKAMWIEDVPELTYEFSFRGDKLTLSHDGESVELQSEVFSNYRDWNLLSIGKSADKSGQIDDIKSINISRSTTSKNPTFDIYLNGNNDAVKNVAGYFYENGLFDFSWSDEDGTVHAYEFVYFYCGYDGLILTDGTNVYRYTEKLV